ncbi:hypothetical protein DVH24_039122 [Malus domestica]|uniref:Aminotransferase-like plant mobile domain-containing protein n=1 Tax=Malus domestica TaxID=3750 RepID=A0A498KBF5_MALDO|nr:hypothetical protein DVH24_039122 [Malus domestica]
MGFTLKHTGMKGVRVKHTTFMKRYIFIQKGQVTKSDVEDVLIKSVTGDTKESRKDCTRLVCLYFYNSVLFSNTATHVSWTIVKLCEDLDQINGYNWATATFDCLLSSLQKLVNPNSVNSCVVALLCLIINMVLKHFWACGKTRLCNKIAGRKNISPSFLTWSMIYFHEKLIQIDLSTMKPHVNHAMVFDTHANDENVLIEKYKYVDDENVLIEKDDTHEINVNKDDTNPQSAFSPIVRPLVIATNGMNDSAIEKSTPHLRMSEMDVRCEMAEIIVHLLMELLMIAAMV